MMMKNKIVKPNYENRRRWVRAKRVLSMEVRLVKTKRPHPDRSWYLTTTQDMSLGGLSFYTDREYRIEETIELRVIMSGVLDIFKGLAEIVRIEKKETGVHSLVAIKFIDKPMTHQFSKEKVKKSVKLMTKSR